MTVESRKVSKKTESHSFQSVNNNMHEGSAVAVPACDTLTAAIHEYERPLMGYALSLLRDAEAARDVVQDTFLKLHQQPPRDTDSALKAWLFTVCRNRALDVIRKEKRMVKLEEAHLDTLESDNPDPAREAEAKESQTTALRLLGRLPENQREVIRLRFQNDLSYKEISNITDLSVSNVGFLMHTGLKKLRGMMQEA